ncbi:hypothetical protein SCUP515_11720 [Seiridium cupressi]
MPLANQSLEILRVSAVKRVAVSLCCHQASSADSEAAELAIGVLGIAGLFFSCIENFDIVVLAKSFGENFELLCTELALERARLRIWGESLGVVPDPSGRKLQSHPALFRPDIEQEIRSSLTQLSTILGKTDVIAGRYALQQETNGNDEHSVGLTVFRDSFKLRERIRKNQKDNITNALEGLERQHTVREKGRPPTMQGIQSEMLVGDIESISDPQSLALLEEVASSASSPSSLRVVSETASKRLSLVTASSRSYYTARTQSSKLSDEARGPWSGHGYAVRQREGPVPVSVLPAQRKTSKKPLQLATTKDPDTETTRDDATEDIPQHRRWMAAMTSHKLPREELKFTANDAQYGISVGDPLDKILASVEAPPGTPYEHGISWITVQLAENQPPKLRFQTRVYHPNIDHTGKLCVDYSTWWQEANQINQYQHGGQWYSRDITNYCSLGSLLVVVCGLLASPDVDDPLVPEIAEIFLTDYGRYYNAAAFYTKRYAQNERPIEDDLIFPSESNDVNGTTEVPIGSVKFRSATMHGLRPGSLRSTNTGSVHALPKGLGSFTDEANPRKEETQTTLLEAAGKGDMYTVRWLLARGARIEKQDRDTGRTPLSLASFKVIGDMVELLLRQGANIESKDDYGKTSLSLAALEGHSDVGKLLLDKGANIESWDNYSRTPLLFAVLGGHNVIVELLLDKGANINATDKNNKTPLSTAAYKGHKKTVELVIHRGADVDSQKEYGQTPLLNAVARGYIDIVELLLGKGASMKSKSQSSQTVMNLAAQEGYETIVQLLADKDMSLRQLKADGPSERQYSVKGNWFRTTLTRLSR